MLGGTKMKILKSGVELTKEEFLKTKGGKRCACGCQEGFVSGELWVSADENKECICGCTPSSGWNSPLVSAREYPF